MANAKEYIEQLAQTAGLSDEDKANMLKAVTTNEKFSKGLEEGVMLRSDYSRNLDQLKAKEKTTGDYYQTLVTWKAEQDRLLAEAMGTGNGNGNVTGEYLTKKDLEVLDKKYQNELNRREQVQISLLKDGMRLASQHAVDFKEPLDTEALAKLAVEKNISLRAAYDEYVGPRRAELQAQSFAEKLKQAKEEGAREFASTHQIPIDTTPRESQYGRLSFNPPEKSVVPDYQPNTGRLSTTGERTLRDGFIDEWNKAGAAPQH